MPKYRVRCIASFSMDAEIEATSAKEALALVEAGEGNWLYEIPREKDLVVEVDGDGDVMEVK